MKKSAYPVKSSFVYLHMFGECAKKDPDKMQVSDSVATILNESYFAGKANGQNKTDRKAEYLGMCRSLMKKAGLVQYASNHKFYVTLLKMIDSAYAEGYNEEKEK
jgi:hypothetical protein